MSRPPFERNVDLVVAIAAIGVALIVMALVMSWQAHSEEIPPRTCAFTPPIEQTLLEAVTAAGIASRPGTDPITQMILRDQALRWLEEVDQAIGGPR
jgi:hypothetical protein